MAISFVCHGVKEDCLKCPLEDCIRQYCVKDGEEISVKVVANPPRKNDKEYCKDYYWKHREKRKEYMRNRYHAKKESMV